MYRKYRENYAKPPNKCTQSERIRFNCTCIRKRRKPEMDKRSWDKMYRKYRENYAKPPNKCTQSERGAARASQHNP